MSNNATYIATNLYNKQMYSIGNILVENIRQDSNIKEGTPIVIAGKLNFSIQNDELLKFTNFDVTEINLWTWQIFLQDNLGLGWNICDYLEYNDITSTKEFNEMPIYPYYGYIISNNCNKECSKK